ncbi:glycosyltransferase family 2 protein [Nitrospira defluvii]|uniref:glycosyltransferase family 2 protein n=1 Tax=Nitrospira defluvii TaxID=330214 RepID=UPI001BB48596|nr:glycosyltransferase family A protein [Nitrospira defluvii]
MAHISVVIPAYNGTSRYLEQAIRSVLAQSYQDCEIIVVDDASTDNTEALVHTFPDVRYVRHARNAGQAAARNTGARLAMASYLAFLDQDDLWEPTFLEETLALLEPATEAALVHCDGYQVNERNEILEYDAAMKQQRSITQLLRGGHDAATSGSLFRRTCFDAVGGYDAALSIWEDIDLIIRLYAPGRFIHLPRPLYRHRLYAHNASRDIPSLRALDGRRRFLEKHAAACRPGTPEGNALSHDWAVYYADLGKHHLRAHTPAAARQAFQSALRHEPLNVKTWSRLVRSYFI